MFVVWEPLMFNWIESLGFLYLKVGVWDKLEFKSAGLKPTRTEFGHSLIAAYQEDLHPTRHAILEMLWPCRLAILRVVSL